MILFTRYHIGEFFTIRLLNDYDNPHGPRNRPVLKAGTYSAMLSGISDHGKAQWWSITVDNHSYEVSDKLVTH